MIKVNNKDIRTTSWRRSAVFIVNFKRFSHLNVSIVNFEQVNAGWVSTALSYSNLKAYSKPQFD